MLHKLWQNYFNNVNDSDNNIMHIFQLIMSELGIQNLQWGQQQDAEEVYRNLLHHLDEIFSEHMDASIINVNFFFNTETATICTHCQMEVSKNESDIIHFLKFRPNDKNILLSELLRRQTIYNDYDVLSDFKCEMCCLIKIIGRKTNKL